MACGTRSDVGCQLSGPTARQRRHRLRTRSPRSGRRAQQCRAWASPVTITHFLAWCQLTKARAALAVQALGAGTWLAHCRQQLGAPSRSAAPREGCYRCGTAPSRRCCAAGWQHCGQLRCPGGSAASRSRALLPSQPSNQRLLSTFNHTSASLLQQIFHTMHAPVFACSLDSQVGSDSAMLQGPQHGCRRLLSHLQRQLTCCEAM